MLLRDILPVAPQKPKFDTSRDLRKAPSADREPSGCRRKFSTGGRCFPNHATLRSSVSKDHWPNIEPAPTADTNGEAIRFDHVELRPKKKRRFLKAMITLAVIVAIFGGLIYGAVYYVKSHPSTRRSRASSGPQTGPCEHRHQSSTRPES
jgi:hypothetical protein